MNNLFINKKRHSRMSPKRSVGPGSTSEDVGEPSDRKRLIVSQDQQSYTPKVKYLNFGNERRVTAPSRVSAPIDAKHKSMEQLITNVKGVDCLEKNSRRKLEIRSPKPIKNAVLVRKGSDGFSQDIHFNSQNGQVSTPEPCQESRPSQLQKEMSCLQQTIIGHDSARPVSSKINHAEVECFNPPPSCDVGQTVKLENEIIKPDYIDYKIAEAEDETSEQILGSDRRVTAPSKVLAPVDAKRKLEQLITNVKEVGCSKNSRRKVWPPKPFTNPVLARTGLGTDGVSQEIHFNSQNRHVSSFRSCQVSRPSKLLKERSYLQQTSGCDSARPEGSKINHVEVKCFDQPPSCDVGLADKLRANPALPQTTSDLQGLENEIIKRDYLDYNIAEAETSEQNHVGDKSPQEDPSHDKVRKLLGLYKDTVERLKHENKMRPRGQRYMGIAINVKAAMQLKKENKWLNVNTCVGHVPGVKVGDQFQSRAELVIVGLHSKFMAGIDYYKDMNGKFYATAIIASGRYIGDRNDNADVLTYVGEGGNPQDKFSKANDQQLVRGNLALKNSIDKKPVRVIRSIEEPKSKDASSVKRSRYVYDGLYLVKKCWSEHDPSGNSIFKFQLNRIHKQPQLATHAIVRKFSKTSYGNIVIADISKGKESIPIHVVNEYDLQKPPHFKYMTMMIWSQLCTISMPFSCDCNNGCSEDKPCFCIIKNKTEGSTSNSVSIVEEKPIIYECGTSCKCPPECKYRLSQHGIRLQLEVFRDGSSGWGVRSRNFISAGRFICEYVGELLLYKQEDGRIDFSSSTTRNSYGISDHDTNNETYGNVGRFIRYHCSPNLYAKCVLFDHEDRRRPHVMLFAAKNIPPLKELTFDYKLWGQEGQKDK